MQRFDHLYVPVPPSHQDKMLDAAGDLLPIQIFSARCPRSRGWRSRRNRKGSTFIWRKLGGQQGKKTEGLRRDGFDREASLSTVHVGLLSSTLVSELLNGEAVCEAVHVAASLEFFA